MSSARTAAATISLRPVDLGAEAATIVAALRHQDPGRRACFTIQQPAWALADLDLIRDVLHNLLGNAWKFTSGRGDASIEFGLAPGTDGRVCCHVRDNGAGFDPAYTHKLFQPFQRLHTTRVSRHRHRPGQRAPDHGPAPRPHLGRGHGRQRHHLLLHPPGRRTGRPTR